MTYVHVINKRTGDERKNVTLKAYNLMTHLYKLVGYVDENGNPVEAPSNAPKARLQAKTTQKKSAGPVVNKLTPEQIEAKKAELAALNQQSIDKMLAQQKEHSEEKRPVGRPRTNA